MLFSAVQILIKLSVVWGLKDDPNPYFLLHIWTNCENQQNFSLIYGIYGIYGEIVRTALNLLTRYLNYIKDFRISRVW